MAARLLAILALGTGVVAAYFVTKGVYRAITDAWVAPLQLSPDSRDVMAVRIQAAKQKEEFARLQSELTTAGAEIAAIDLGLKNLQSMAVGYKSAVRRTANGRKSHTKSLSSQQALLDRQQTLLLKATGRDQAALSRARLELKAGVITAAQLQAAESAVSRSQLTKAEKEFEYLRVTTDLDVQIARLEADRRSAEGRQGTARAGLGAMEELQSQLSSTPLFVAAQRDIDLAFVTYAHMKNVRERDIVYNCRWLIFKCIEVGYVKHIFPGEVVADDPWGSPARGRYVEMQMLDRRAMNEKTLRVRQSTPTLTQNSR